MLTVIGVLLQVICYFMPEGNHNTLLLISFLLVMAGMFLYIYTAKKDSRY